MDQQNQITRSAQCTERAAEIERYAGSLLDKSTREAMLYLAWSWRMAAESNARIEQRRNSP